MASGHSSSDQPVRHSADKVANESQVADSRSAKNESQLILDEVLQATLQLSRADEPLEPEVVRALVAVARRRQSEPLTSEVVTELVETVLRLRFRRVIESSGLWDRMTRQIATTIFDDPRAKEGMRRFWERLCEAAK